MNAPSVDIKSILEAAGVGTFQTDLFVGTMPNGPDICVAVMDTGGFAPQSGYSYRRPTVQVSVRGSPGTYTAAYAKAESVVTALQDYRNDSWGEGVRYLGVWAFSEILFLGYDELNRPVFSVNFRVHRTG